MRESKEPQEDRQNNLMKTFEEVQQTICFTTKGSSTSLLLIEGQLRSLKSYLLILIRNLLREKLQHHIGICIKYFGVQFDCV